MTANELKSEIDRRRDAMTREGLYSKSRIAEELAARDIEIDRLRAVLDQYANPLNWQEDSAGISRVWLEPDSTTPARYNGFDAARAALKA